MKERLIKFLAYLKIGQKQFEQKAGLSNGYVDKVSDNITLKSLNKIESAYPELNISWLKTGEGEMLNREKNGIQFYDHDNMPANKRLIPLWDDVSTIGGKLEKGYSANLKSSYSSPTEWIDPGDWFKGVTAAMRHYEQSMIEYPSGCILALKEVQEWRLLIPGRNYVFDTPEYRVTKKIESIHINEFITVRSTNEEKYDDGKLIHPPFDIQWDLIGRIFEVLGYVVKTGSGTMVYTNQK